MLYRKILNIIEENSEFDGQDSNLIKDNSFHKLAEDLNALFFLNSSSSQLKEKHKTVDDIKTLKDLYEAYPNGIDYSIKSYKGKLFYLVDFKVVKTVNL